MEVFYYTHERVFWYTQTIRGVSLYHLGVHIHWGVLLHQYIICDCNSCSMGTSDLPDIYALALGPNGPRACADFLVDKLVETHNQKYSLVLRLFIQNVIH